MILDCYLKDNVRPGRPRKQKSTKDVAEEEAVEELDEDVEEDAQEAASEPTLGTTPDVTQEEYEETLTIIAQDLHNVS